MGYTKKLTIPVESWRTARLKKLVAKQGIHVTVLVRQALDEYEQNHGSISWEERVRRVREILAHSAGPVADPETMEMESMPTEQDLAP